MLHWTPQRLLQPGRDIPSCLASYLSGNNTIDQALVLSHLLSGDCTGVSGTGSPARGWPGSATAGKLCPHCWLWPGPSATSSALTRDPAPRQLCSGATEPSALPFCLSPGSAEPAPQVSASPVLSGSVQSTGQMLGTRAGAVLAVLSSGGFCHLTRATFLAKTNVLSHTSQLPLQHELLLPGLTEGRGWRSDAKVLKSLCM